MANTAIPATELIEKLMQNRELVPSDAQAETQMQQAIEHAHSLSIGDRMRLESAIDIWLERNRGLAVHDARGNIQTALLRLRDQIKVSPPQRALENMTSNAGNLTNLNQPARDWIGSAGVLSVGGLGAVLGLRTLVKNWKEINKPDAEGNAPGGWRKLSRVLYALTVTAGVISGGALVFNLASKYLGSTSRHQTAPNHQIEQTTKLNATPAARTSPESEPQIPPSA